MTVHPPGAGRARIDPAADPLLQAAIGAAIASHLDAETAGAVAPSVPGWALAERPSERGAGQPWPVGRVRWATAEWPR